ncbi:MAG: MFS transporter [Armatimonadota bacterium]
MSAAPESVGGPWWRGVPRYAWVVLAISALGWLFDTMDQQLFNLVRQPSLKELLGPEAPKELVTRWSGILTSVFLIGWAVGGFVFGALGDRLGRARTMAITVLIYAGFTGLNGFVDDPVSYAVCRFFTALGVGGEFAAGAALVAEVFPQRSRPLALGFLQALSAVGNSIAAVITLLLSSVPVGGWRIAFFIGAAPAVLVFFIRRVVREPEAWSGAREQASSEGLAIGSIAGLFRDPVLQRNTVAGTLLAIAGVGGLWGVGFWLPDLIGNTFSHLPAKELGRFRSMIAITQQAGAFLGMLGYAAVSERVGRRKALLGAFLLAFVAVQLTFRNLHDVPTAYGYAFLLGICALSPFAAYAIYFPELFPTRLRATGVGFCYNCARLVAAAAPLLLGQLAARYASPIDPSTGLRTAASIVACVYIVGLIGLSFAPETRGKPLPE